MSCKMAFRTVLCLSIVVIAFVVNGCGSLIGLGVGAIIDSNKPDSLYISGWKAEKVKIGKNVGITLNDGKQLIGKYKGLELIPSEEYAQRYNETREKSLPDVILPPLGDTIGITQKSGMFIEREFLGFDYRYQPTETKGEKESSPFTPVLVTVKVKESTVAQNLSSTKLIKFSDSRGNVLVGEVLERLSSKGQIPFLSAISLENSEVQMLIPREKVLKIERENGKYAKWIGLGIGAAMDITFIVLMASSDMSIN
jgi:hypothetical protein